MAYPIGLPKATIPFSELVIQEKIGRGSFMDVYRAIWRKTEVAVKKLPDNNALDKAQIKKELFREASIMLYEIISRHVAL